MNEAEINYELDYLIAEDLGITIDEVDEKPLPEVVILRDAMLKKHADLLNA